MFCVQLLLSSATDVAANQTGVSVVKQIDIDMICRSLQISMLDLAKRKLAV